MAQTVLSTYITEEEIRICEVRKKGKNIQVSRVLSTQTPKNSVDGGMIVNVEEVAQTLRELFGSNAVKKGKLAFTIASKRIASKEVTVPYVKNKKRIAEMIQANIQDYFPMGNLEEYIWRYTIVDTVKTEEIGHYNIALTAVRKDMIASYYELAAELKLPVETVDYYGNSIYSMICRQMEAEEGTALALQVDREVTHVSIMEGATQLFRRTIPHGRETLIQTFAENRGIHPEEAQRLLTDGTQEEGITEQEYRETVSELAASIARVVDFYTTKNPGIRVERARIFGEGLSLTGLAPALERELEIEVAGVWKLEGVVIPKKNPYGVSMELLSWYLPNLGVMLASLGLKPEEEKKKISSMQVLQGLVIAAALAAAAMTGLGFYQNYRLKEQKVLVDAENDKLAYAEQMYLAYTDMENEYDRLMEYYATTKSDTEMFYPLILTLEEVMPQSVAIGDISVDNGEVSVTGYAAGKIPVADFIIELKKIPGVSNVKVSKTADSNEGSLTEFEMSFHIGESGESGEETEGGTAE